MHDCRESINERLVIGSFGDAATEDLFHGLRSAKVRRYPRDILKAAVRKLDMINGAHILDDLRSPPGNRLEALRGDLRGFHSIRINEQWRVVFRWDGGDAQDVRIVDYH